jgi:hypothetical protein
VYSDKRRISLGVGMKKYWCWLNVFVLLPLLPWGKFRVYTKEEKNRTGEREFRSDVIRKKKAVTQDIGSRRVSEKSRERERWGKCRENLLRTFSLCEFFSLSLARVVLSSPASNFHRHSSSNSIYIFILFRKGCRERLSSSLSSSKQTNRSHFYTRKKQTNEPHIDLKIAHRERNLSALRNHPARERVRNRQRRRRRRGKSENFKVSSSSSLSIERAHTCEHRRIFTAAAAFG